MLQTLIRSLVVVLVLAGGMKAQTNRAVGPSEASLSDRARSLEPYLARSAERYGLDARLLGILCFMESRFRVDAVSPKGARGPMQLMPDTARRYGVLNPHDPQQSFDGAARYLRDLLNRFGGRIDLAMAAYNAGEGAVESFRTGRPLLLPTGKLINPRRLVTGGIPPYTETREYVRQGLTLLRRQEPSQSLLIGRLTTLRSQTRSRRHDFTLDTSAESENVPAKSPIRIASFIDVQ
jgi:soluble lytic murein transglycosylase-like protein